MKKRSGKYFGYFTSERFENGSWYFKFTHHEHVSLIKRTTGIIHKKGKDNSFQTEFVVPKENQNDIRELIKNETLIVIKLEKGNLSEVYELKALSIYGIP